MSARNVRISETGMMYIDGERTIISRKLTKLEMESLSTDLWVAMQEEEYAKDKHAGEG